MDKLFYILDNIFEDFIMALCATSFINVLFPSEVNITIVGVFIVSLIFAIIKFISVIISSAIGYDFIYELIYFIFSYFSIFLLNLFVSNVVFTAGFVGTTIIVFGNYILNEYFVGGIKEYKE